MGGYLPVTAKNRTAQKLPPSLPFLIKNPYLCAAKKSLKKEGLEGKAALYLAVYESLIHHIETPNP